MKPYVTIQLESCGQSVSAEDSFRGALSRMFRTYHGDEINSVRQNPSTQFFLDASHDMKYKLARGVVGKNGLMDRLSGGSSTLRQWFMEYYANGLVVEGGRPISTSAAFIWPAIINAYFHVNGWVFEAQGGTDFSWQSKTALMITETFQARDCRTIDGVLEDTFEAQDAGFGYQTIAMAELLEDEGIVSRVKYTAQAVRLDFYNAELFEHVKGQAQRQLDLSRPSVSMMDAMLEEIARAEVSLYCGAGPCVAAVGESAA